MKYLFINSLAGLGSTGRICAEKCRELMALGHECCIAYGREKGNCEDIPTIQIGTPMDYRVHAALNRITDAHGFYSRRATERFLEQLKGYDPDVIWLHNVHGYYVNLEVLFSYLRTCGKRILWTLHDCWAMTGHCAYFDYVGCKKWQTACHHCPQKKAYPATMLVDGSSSNYEKKKSLFTGIPNLTITVPSHWLETRVKQSFLKEYPVEVVYNTINTDIFKPTPGDFRQKHNLQNCKIILGVANVWEPRKGLKDFVALAPMLDDRFKIVLVGLSPEQIKELPPEILGLPRTSSPYELAEVYTAADIYVNPSVEETFGLTILEAQACGTPAIVYEDTACEEVAREFGGRVVRRGAAHIFNELKAFFEEESV